MAVNVVLTRKFFEADLQFIKNGVKDGANIINPEAFTEDDLMKYAPEADIFFGPVISKRLCEAATHLRFIQVPWTGVDNLNFDLIREIGVKVCNSHSNAYAVAEQALALMFDAAKKIAYHDRLMRTGDWNRPKPDKSNAVSPFSGRVSKSQVGIIGFGHIGRIIKQYLSAMECLFHVADISVKEQKVEDGINFYPMASLKEMLGKVDYVFLCVPLTETTRGFFGAEQFATMKDTAIMINTSRGEIVDEDALYAALKDKKIGGAGMDTWYNNPKNPFDTDCKPSLKNPFETLDNLVLSPHRAAMIAGELPHLEDAVMNINRIVDGLEPLNVVSVEKKF